jgi:hypothetical protein
MSHKEILIEAIKKAAANGWEVPAGNIEGFIDFIYETRRGENGLLFSHEFAKALWGESTEEPDVITDALTGLKHKPWIWHIQNMVIADDPIIYLGDNI